ncbi:MAG: hypothetical protein KGL53_07925, partial [Elusimicrobia bacterium]|nr:hypothetical protein [Elusimicrobiota bacterium]
SPTYIDDFIYGAAYGIDQRSNNAKWYGGAFGYKPDGTSAADTTSEYYLSSVAGSSTHMQWTRVNPLHGIDVSNIGSGANVISYDQDADTGSIRLWGDVALANSSATLATGFELFDATATTPKLMRGTGHSLTVTNVAAAAVSQVIDVEYRGGLWHVDGSSSGLEMSQFGGSVVGLQVPSSNPQFTMNFTPGTPQEGDRVDFALLAGTGDSAAKKRLLFGPAAPSFNGGKTRLLVSPSGGIGFAGNSSSWTVVDSLNPGTLYYTFIDSGSFSAVYSSFTHMDSQGIQLASTTVLMSTSSFDAPQVIAASSVSYITASAPILAPSATFYGLFFGNSNSTQTAAAAYNVNVTGGGALWTFRHWSGPMGGGAHDADPPGGLSWSPFQPGSAAQDFLMVGASSVTIAWAPGNNDAGMWYEVQANTFSFANGGIVDSYPVTGLQSDIAGLTPNTSWYLRVWAYEPGSQVTSPTSLQLPATATLVEPPDGVWFDEVSSNSITVVAYSTGGFSGLNRGVSGTNVTTATYNAADWHSEGWQTRGSLTVARQGL